MRRILAIVILLVVAGTAGAVVESQRHGGSKAATTVTTTTVTTTTPATTTTAAPKDSARAAVQRFEAAWSAGEDEAAGKLTNHPVLAANALVANRKGLDGASIAVKTVSLDDTAKANATARLGLTWKVAGYGPWTYDTTMHLRRLKIGTWVILWDPKIVHPALTSKTRLGTDRIDPVRAPILDRDGNALIEPRPVVQVGLERDKVKNVKASATALAKLLKIDVASYVNQVRHAGKVEFVVAVTLRPSAYAKVSKKVDAIVGSVANSATMPLGPSFGFARALLGAVAPATAEQIKQSHGTLSIGDEVGQWGLEAAYNRHLAGTQDISIITRSRATGDGLSTLRLKQGRRPTPLRTTISTKVQNAAEAALGGMTAPSAIIAVQPSSGDILAVADRPMASTFDRALAGAYTPGSTFKVVTTTSLLEHGFDPSSSVPCPRTIKVYGRTFRNFEGESGASSSFDEDFAISCNTAFISLAPKLSRTSLTKTALEFGLGKNDGLPFGSASSHVPLGGDAVSRAAMMIGQDRIVATPLAMAGVAATVASGRWHQPRLLNTDPRVTGAPVSASALGTVRSLMRLVVTRGTGSALASTPGEPACKTGTAEFGGGTPPPTHAWFICYRGDMAIAVLVERGRSGGAVAAPIAARFFADYDRG